MAEFPLARVGLGAGVVGGAGCGAGTAADLGVVDDTLVTDSVVDFTP